MKYVVEEEVVAQECPAPKALVSRIQKSVTYGLNDLVDRTVE
jgi:hypothetical protein